MEGFMLGVVKENYDKDHAGMVQVTLPSFADGGDTTAWLPVVSPYAGKNYGAYLLPEKDDQVIVGFLGGNAHGGVVLGSLWNAKNTIPPDASTEDNTVRALITKGGHALTVTDGEDGTITIKSAQGHAVVIDDKAKTLTLSTSDKKNTITLNQDKAQLTIQSGDKLVIQAKDISIDGKVTIKGQGVTVNAENEIAIKGKQLKLEGTTMKLEGQSAEIKGTSVKVESSGILTLKGAMTKIN